MEEMDGRIQRKVETVARRNCLRSVLAGPSCSKSCSSANATAVSDRAAPAKGRQDQEEALARADFCPRRCGDIASCKNPEGARATAKLIEQIPGTVFAAGDLAYEKGSAEDFKN